MPQDALGVYLNNHLAGSVIVLELLERLQDEAHGDPDAATFATLRGDIEANRQVRYLSLSVSPVAPDVPTYPRVFENTLVTLLILLGVYLMFSMTVAILREQVSS